MKSIYVISIKQWIALFLALLNKQKVSKLLLTIQLNSELNNLFYGETVITIPFLPHLSKLIGIEIEKQKEDIEYLTNVENIIRRTLIFDKPKLMEIEVFDSGIN